jgi:hypothetical protein
VPFRLTITRSPNGRVFFQNAALFIAEIVEDFALECKISTIDPLAGFGEFYDFVFFQG